jgi:rSAM/selenodomain-associated transferase 2
LTDRPSVIIPALNEERHVATAIRSARGEAGEVIVVDGGSQDRTAVLAREEGAEVLSSAPGRGIQLDLGARRARGPWLVFLHADTWLEPGWSLVLRGLDAHVPGGAFRFAVDSPRWGYRLIEAGVALRCRLFHLPYGDQAIFVRQGAYLEAGGFAPFPLMEDVDFVRRLRRRGPLGFPAVRAVTSPRRWEQNGMVTTTLKNASLLGLYVLGTRPERLAALYGARDERPFPEAILPPERPEVAPPPPEKQPA